MDCRRNCPLEYVAAVLYQWNGVKTWKPKIVIYLSLFSLSTLVSIVWAQSQLLNTLIQFILLRFPFLCNKLEIPGKKAFFAFMDFRLRRYRYPGTIRQSLVFIAAASILFLTWSFLNLLHTSSGEKPDGNQWLQNFTYKSFRYWCLRLMWTTDNIDEIHWPSLQQVP